VLNHNPVIQIVLVGRQRVVLDSLGNLIAGQPDLRVVGESNSDGVMPVACKDVDIVVFDLDEADDEGVFERLQKISATVRTIAVSISTGAAMSFRVFQAGAMGLVSKRQPPALLLLAIRKVHAGEAWVGRTTISQVLDLARAKHRNTKQVIKTGSAALTARDRQLIALVGEGWRNADIARHLIASEATVRASLTSIFKKLGVPNRFALMVYASQHGYVNVKLSAREPASML
jgi:DNA-binding NarL/FixJ family response regulator